LNKNYGEKLFPLKIASAHAADKSIKNMALLSKIKEADKLLQKAIMPALNILI
jgi:hypothetical protein